MPLPITIPKGLNVPPLTNLTRKRLYIPTVDVSENPFCQDRQISDKVNSITRKPQMVVDLEVALMNKATTSTLPTSVFAPAKDIMVRKRNKLFGTMEGAEYILSQKSHQRTKDGKFDDEDGPGIFVPDPNDVFAPADKTYFPDPFEVASGLTTKPPKLQDTTAPTTFGHRPRSASRHFDPLTMNANRFGRSAKNLPVAGLLSASDLHKMLKHGQDVVGMGPSPADRGEAPLNASVSSLSPSIGADTGSSMNVMGASSSSSTMNLNGESTLGSTLGGGESMLGGGGGGGGGGSGGDSVDLMIMQPSVTQRTTAMTIMEREAPLGLIQAPGWMGGVYSTGLGKSLFDKTQTEKIAISLKKKERRKKKKHRAGRPEFHSKIYRPPPQRAFRSQLQEDDFSLMTSKEKLSRFAKLGAGNTKMNTCELRQKIDLKLSKEAMNRIKAQKSDYSSRREYTLKGISSTTPRKRFTHNITEIEKEVARRLRIGTMRDEDEQEEEETNDESAEEVVVVGSVGSDSGRY